MCHAKAPDTSSDSSSSSGDDDEFPDMQKLRLTDGADTAASSKDNAAARVKKTAKKKEEQRAKPKSEGDAGFVEGWPDNVACETCIEEGFPDRLRDHWKRLHRWWSEGNDQSTPSGVASAGRTEGDGQWLRSCWRCIQKRQALPDEATSRLWILHHRVGAQRRDERNKTFKAVMADTEEHMPGMSKKGKRLQVHLSLLAAVFRPIMDLLVLKAKWMARRDQDLAERSDLLKQFHEAKGDPEKQFKLLEKLEAWEENYEKTTGRPLAFASRGGAEVQEAYMKAADYADAWTESPHGSFKGFYFCEHALPYGGKCNTLITSKGWARKHEVEAELSVEAATRKKQSWYCGACGCKYSTNYGQLVEIYGRDPKSGATTVHCWVKAPVPDWLDHMDVKAMAIERAFGAKATTPLDLFKLLPERLPQVARDFLRPLQKSELSLPGLDPNSHLRVVNEAYLEQLPEFKWDYIFKCIGLEMPQRPPSKKKKGGRK